MHVNSLYPSQFVGVVVALVATTTMACPNNDPKPVASDAGSEVVDTSDAEAETDTPVDAEPEVVLTEGRCGSLGEVCEEGCESSLTCVCALTKADLFPFRLYQACDADHPCAAGEICGPGVRNARSFCHASDECASDDECAGLPVNDARCLAVLGGGVCIEARDGALGDDCAVTEDCGAGLLCIFGACRATCDQANAGSCGTDAECVAYTTDGLLAGTGGCVATPCDPFSTVNTCPADSQCVQDHYDSEGRRWFGRCVPSAEVNCSALDCDPGTACRPGSIAGCDVSCDPFIPPDQTGCDDGVGCTSLYDAGGRIVRGYCDRQKVCDVANGDGCSQLNQCFPGFASGLCSGQVVGSRGEGELCSHNSISDEGCQRGFVCTPGVSNAQGVCRAVCAQPDACGAEALCTPVFLRQPTIPDGSLWVSQPFGACRPRCVEDTDCASQTDRCWQSWGVCLASPTYDGLGASCQDEGRPCGDDRICSDGGCRATCRVEDPRLFGRVHASCEAGEVCQGRTQDDPVGVCREPAAECAL